MQRRTFLGVITGGLLAAPLAARAQQAGRVWRIGYLTNIRVQTIDDIFIGSLRELGYVEGQNLIIEFRDAAGNAEKLPLLAADLARRGVDAIVAWGTPPALAAKRATSTITIILSLSGDAVGTGLVASLARPGGNITGITFIAPETSAKRLQLLREAFPRLSHVATLWDPNDAFHVLEHDEMVAAANTLRVTVEWVKVQRAQEFDGAVAAITRSGAEAVVAFNSAAVMAARHQLVERLAASRLPTMYGRREMVDAGGLMSYGPSFPELVRRAAVYVDKILKGTKPADLPVEQPQKFELVINLKTAKALGLTISPSLMSRADEVIQ